MTNKMWPRRSLISGMSAVAAAFALGARPAGFLQKPYTASQLTSKVAELVQARA